MCIATVSGIGYLFSHLDRSSSSKYRLRYVYEKKRRRPERLRNMTVFLPVRVLIEQMTKVHVSVLCSHSPSSFTSQGDR